jgi:hypothetical protein
MQKNPIRCLSEKDVFFMVFEFFFHLFCYANNLKLLVRNYVIMMGIPRLAQPFISIGTYVVLCDVVVVTVY